MCSILGIIDFKNKYPQKKESIYKLNKLMNHRAQMMKGFIMMKIFLLHSIDFR